MVSGGLFAAAFICGFINMMFGNRDGSSSGILAYLAMISTLILAFYMFYFKLNLSYVLLFCGMFTMLLDPFSELLKSGEYLAYAFSSSYVLFHLLYALLVIIASLAFITVGIIGIIRNAKPDEKLWKPTMVFSVIGAAAASVLLVYSYIVYLPALIQYTGFSWKSASLILTYTALALFAVVFLLDVLAKKKAGKGKVEAAGIAAADITEKEPEQSAD